MTTRSPFGKVRRWAVTGVGLALLAFGPSAWAQQSSNSRSNDDRDRNASSRDSSTDRDSSNDDDDIGQDQSDQDRSRNSQSRQDQDSRRRQDQNSQRQSSQDQQRQRQQSQQQSSQQQNGNQQYDYQQSWQHPNSQQQNWQNQNQFGGQHQQQQPYGSQQTFNAYSAGSQSPTADQQYTRYDQNQNGQPQAQNQNWQQNQNGQQDQGQQGQNWQQNQGRQPQYWQQGQNQNQQGQDWQQRQFSQNPNQFNQQPPFDSQRQYGQQDQNQNWQQDRNWQQNGQQNQWQQNQGQQGQFNHQGQNNNQGGNNQGGNDGPLGITLSAHPTHGVQVTEVSANTPASHAGLQVGDQIVAVNGRHIYSNEDLIRQIHATGPQQGPLNLTVLRNGRTENVQAALFAHGPVNNGYNNNGNNNGGFVGNQDRGSFQRERPALGITMQQAGPNQVRITNVYPGSPAQRAGLQPGDRIVSIDRQPVGHEHDVMNLVSQSHPDQRLPIEVERNGQFGTIWTTPEQPDQVYNQGGSR